ncbi:MAG: monovalent cation/H+ antiporter subunit D [Celeribacter sp.]
MMHWITLPIILPAMLGAVTVLALRHHLLLQRVFSTAGTVAVLAITLGLLWQANSGEITVYRLGNWDAPFGIVLVLDRLSALMLTLTAVLALGVQLYAIGSGWDGRGWHFHALFQFQLMGIYGAFLTGDAFNLFVFFEILLIASYGMMIHGGGRRRIRAGVQYVVYNLLGSTLFLFALGTIYAVTGTLNMADLAERVAQLPAEDTSLLRVGAALMLLVFAIKGAVLPLHFWLPETYAKAPAPVAALFAIMTKVGAYAILRVYTLVFGPEVEITADIAGTWLMPAALVTLAAGMIGILGADRLGRMAAFASIGSMGTLMIAIAPFTPEATAAALYYMIHSVLGSALLFLVVDLVRERRGADEDLVTRARPIAHLGLISALFFAAAITMAGMPPLSGFIGKILVMDAVRGEAAWPWIWAVILVTSLIAIVGFGRAGTTVFWKTDDTPREDELDTARTIEAPIGLPATVCFGFLGAIALVTVLSGPLTAYLQGTADQLYAPELYITAVDPQPAVVYDPASGTGKGGDH